MMLEDMSQEKEPIHQENAYLSMVSSEYGNTNHLYMVNDLVTEIVIIYIDNTLEIEYKE